MKKFEFICPVCTFLGLKNKPYESWPPVPGEVILPPYYRQLGDPSYEVCRLCAFEFGFDDDPGGDLPGSSFEEYREEWIKAGMPVFQVEAVREICDEFQINIPSANRARGILPAIASGPERTG